MVTIDPNFFNTLKISGRHSFCPERFPAPAVKGCGAGGKGFLPGFLVQSVVFGSTQTSVGISEDLSKGLVDRFRSLPMARVAFLSGRVFSDAIRYLILIVIMIGVGYAAGFRFEAGFHRSAAQFVVPSSMALELRL